MCKASAPSRAPVTMDSQLDDILKLPFQLYRMLLDYKKTMGVVIEWLATYTVSSENLDRETSILKKKLRRGPWGLVVPDIMIRTSYEASSAR